MTPGSTFCKRAFWLVLVTSLPCSAQGQRSVVAGAGIYESNVGSSHDAVVSATVDVGLRLNRGQALLRGQWWGSDPDVGAVGAYIADRHPQRRFLYGEIGVLATGRREANGDLIVRPGLGVTAGFAFDIGRVVQLRLVSNYVLDSQRAMRSVGLSISVCP